MYLLIIDTEDSLCISSIKALLDLYVYASHASVRLSVNSGACRVAVDVLGPEANRKPGGRTSVAHTQVSDFSLRHHASLRYARNY